MQNQGYPFVGNLHVVNSLPPSTNATGSSNLTSDVMALKNYNRAANIITFSTHADAGILTVYKSSDLTANSTRTIAFTYYYSTQASVDTLSTAQSATSTGISLGTVDNGIVVFEVSMDDLTSTSGISATTDVTFSNFYYTLTESTGQSVSGVTILSGARYVRSPMPTAIA
jgi:hypothetical protein